MLDQVLPPQERISQEYLQAEYAQAGVPVYEINYREWKKRFYHLMGEDYDNAKEFLGEYYNGTFPHDTEGFPSRFILINKSLNYSWRLSIFYHELGHHSCVKARCRCASDGFVFRKTELHACLAAIYLAHERGFKEMTYNMLIDTITDLDHAKFARVYNATRTVKHPVFIVAKKMVEKEIDKFFEKKRNAALKQKYLNAIVDDTTRMCRWHPSSLLRRVAKNPPSL